MPQRIAPTELNINYIASLEVQKRAAGNQGTKKKVSYKDIITAFDIETTRIRAIEQSVMYVWKWAFGTDTLIKGRTWNEFVLLCKELSAHMKDNEYIVVFVHNLSYEFQFLRGIYPFEKEEVFALDSRKVLKCTMFGHFELRCSYLHSNMSLDEYTKKMGAKHLKLSGEEYDYNKMRFSWTPLTEREDEYGDNDVLGLVEAIQNEMKLDRDTLYTFPLTSTGYVRRDAKQAMRAVSHTYVRNQLPDYHTYEMCREAFRGGNTHANRFYSGIIMKDVKSADRSSSYPDVLCNCLFPVSSFFHAGAVSYDELMELINVRKKAVIMRVSMTNVRLHDKFFGAPYLSRDKCRNIDECVFDNGRILEAKYLETTITDIDFKIILSEYDFDDFTSFDVSYARYGKLPQVLIDTNIEYYTAKTELKNVDGQEVYYIKAKNKLNSIYGMMAQDPVKQTIDFICNEFIKHDDDPQELLTMSNRKAFLCYQWGVWCTAWARYRLEEGIRKADDGFIYCDTDSVKYVGDIDWTGYNKQRIKDSKSSGTYATDPNGIIHYMGVFEQEEGYKEFCTLGAKKYAFIENDSDSVKVTIAGVTKKKGGKELEKAGGLSAFKAGFIFGREGGNENGELIEGGAGGTEAVYNDNPPMSTYEVDGHTLDISSNVVLRDSTYKLGITAEYERLLENVQKGIDI